MGYFGTLTFDQMFFLLCGQTTDRFSQLFVRQLVSAMTAVALAAATHVGFVVKMCFLGLNELYIPSLPSSHTLTPRLLQINQSRIRFTWLCGATDSALDF